MKKFVLTMMAIVIFASNGLPAEKPVASDRAHPIQMGFADVFKKKLYEKKYFGIAVTGATVVVAGAFFYFTAGAGAPIAAGGVSTVASWVGGGGAGSYMAGLSTIGSAFGGNAMLGAAILNGVSIATVGGGPAFVSLSAGQKALAMASISATMLDGVAIMDRPGTNLLNYKVALPTPKNIGSKELRQRADELRDLGKEERKLGEKMDDLAADRLKAKEAGKSTVSKDSSKKLAETESKLRETREKRARLEKEIIRQARITIKGSGNPEDVVLLALLSKNIGKSDLFAELIEKVPTVNVKDAGYVYYLKAVAKIERNEVGAAKQLLEQSTIHNPYAIEPQILRVNILGGQGFDANKGEIGDIVSLTEKRFDSEEYATPFSLVSLHYRVGTLALRSKDYLLAEVQFNKALSERSLWEKFGPKNDFDSMIKTGLANALYGQGRKYEASDIVDELLKKAKDGQAREIVCAQLMGRCV